MAIAKAKSLNFKFQVPDFVVLDYTENQWRSF
jgi:hypothetical protein